MCFQTPEVTIHEPGYYRLRLFANNEFLVERWLIVQSSVPGDPDWLPE